MPNAIAPNAPWVLVWESPQAIVVPGWVMPLLGPHDVDDALLAGRAVEKGDPVVAAVLAQVLDHGVSEGIGEGLCKLVGRDDVVHRGKRAVRHGDLEA